MAAEKNLANVKKAMERAIDNKDLNKILTLIEGLKSSAQNAGTFAGRQCEAQRFKEAGERPIYRQDFEKRAAQCNRDGEAFNNTMLQALGKIEYVYNAFKQTNGHAQAAMQLKIFMGEMTKAAYDLGAHMGAFQENMEYIHELDKKIQAAGGRKSVQVISMQALEQITPDIKEPA